MPASNSFEIYPSESFKLLVDIEPWYYDDSNVEIKWSSANTNYVTVSEDIAVKDYNIRRSTLGGNEGKIAGDR